MTQAIPFPADAAAVQPPVSAAAKKSAFKSIFIVASGNFLEMFDFMVFGYYATYISKAFFPTGSEFASLMLTLMTFGAGFLMRPVGALVLGAYIDRKGRRRRMRLPGSWLGLLRSGFQSAVADDRIGFGGGQVRDQRARLGLMALGTLAIAVTPTYAQIGLAAPIIILIGRLIQGLSAGVEVGGVSVYLNEIAPPHRKGFFTSWQSASQQAAVVFAALIGLLVSTNLSPETMQA